MQRTKSLTIMLTPDEHAAVAAKCAEANEYYISQGREPVRLSTYWRTVILEWAEEHLPSTLPDATD